MVEKKENGIYVPNVPYGITINHMPPGMSEYAERILQLGDIKRTVLKHVNSTRYGKKDMIKIDMTEEQFKTGKLEELMGFIKKNDDKLGLISTKITIYYIINYEKKDVWHPVVPDRVEGIVKCINPNCLTKTDRHTVQTFLTMSRDPLKLKCEYCEKIMDQKMVLESLV